MPTDYCKCGRSIATRQHLAKCPKSGYETIASRIIAALRANPKASYSEIAKAVKADRAYVITIANAYELTRGPRGDRSGLSSVTKGRIAKLLKGTNKSYREIGSLAGASYQSVKKYAKKHNLPLRHPDNWTKGRTVLAQKRREER